MQVCREVCRLWGRHCRAIWGGQFSDEAVDGRQGQAVTLLGIQGLAHEPPGLGPQVEEAQFPRAIRETQADTSFTPVQQLAR